jgi:hypothetical protein
MAPDKLDEAVLSYVRELAKRLAREDHEVETPTSNRTSLD